MKTNKVSVSGLAAIPLMLFALCAVAMGVFMCVASIYGLILAFKASVVLGILALFVEPSPAVFGLAMIFAKTNLPQLIVAWAHAHGF